MQNMRARSLSLSLSLSLEICIPLRLHASNLGCSHEAAAILVRIVTRVSCGRMCCNKSGGFGAERGERKRDVQGDCGGQIPWLGFGVFRHLAQLYYTASSAKFPSVQSEQGRQWNDRNRSQPNPGSHPVPLALRGGRSVGGHYARALVFIAHSSYMHEGKERVVD